MGQGRRGSLAVFSRLSSCCELGEDGESLVAVVCTDEQERVFKTAEWVPLLDRVAALLKADIRKIKPGHKRVAVGES